MIQLYTAPVTCDGHTDAYALLEQAHLAFRGCAAPAIWKTQAGKPFFVDGSLEFSLSHSKTLAACVLSDEGSVGVDAEDLRSVRPGVEQRVMTAEERLWLEQQPDRDAAFLTLWTRKEAWVKQTGQGLDGQPQRVDVMPDKSRAVCFRTIWLGCSVVTVCTAPGSVVQLPPGGAEMARK